MSIDDQPDRFAGRSPDRPVRHTTMWYVVGPRGHWYAKCYRCGRWIKRTGAVWGVHLCVGHDHV